MSSKGQKRRKAQYVGNGKRHKGGRQLEVGMQGILITCNMNERTCLGEAYSLLKKYGDKLYGPEICEKEDEPSGTVEDEDDVEASLEKEDQICTSTEKNLRRFQSVESGANNVIFIRTQNIEPAKFVQYIFRDLYTSDKKVDAILRMLPVTDTCKAFRENLKKYAETFLQPWFKVPNKGTFQIECRARNHHDMNKNDVIKDLAGIVANLNPENKVDLDNPEYTIVVEIIKNICCLSVVKDYVLFKKYNLREAIKSPKLKRI